MPWSGYSVARAEARASSSARALSSSFEKEPRPNCEGPGCMTRPTTSIRSIFAAPGLARRAQTARRHRRDLLENHVGPVLGDLEAAKIESGHLVAFRVWLGEARPERPGQPPPDPPHDGALPRPRPELAEEVAPNIEAEARARRDEFRYLKSPDELRRVLHPDAVESSLVQTMDAVSGPPGLRTRSHADASRGLLPSLLNISDRDRSVGTSVRASMFLAEYSERYERGGRGRLHQPR